MTDEAILTRRVSLPDMFVHAKWLIERLKVKYPHLRDDTIHGWLRAKVESNDFLFITNDYGVALAEMIHENLSPQPSVVERFVLCPKAEYAPQAADLYSHILRWAQSMGAKDITVEQFTDIPRSMIKDRLGRLSVRETMVARVEKTFIKAGEKLAG